MADSDEDKLLEGIKSSIMDMQQNMQDTYSGLSKQLVTGKSDDGTISVTLTATYGFHDIAFDKEALRGGVGDFKERIKQAFTNASQSVQTATQEKTMELLQGMQVPDEIKNISMDELEKARKVFEEQLGGELPQLNDDNKDK